MLFEPGCDVELGFSDVVFMAGCAGDDVDSIGGGEGECAECWEGCLGVRVMDEFPVFIVGGKLCGWWGIVVGEL